MLELHGLGAMQLSKQQRSYIWVCNRKVVFGAQGSHFCEVWERWLIGSLTPQFWKMISRKEYTITNSKIFKIKKLPRLFPIIYYVDTGGSLIIGKISQKKCTLLRFELTQGML